MYKYLGLLISSALSWSNHIQGVCSKARKILGLLYRKYCKVSDKATLLQLYTSIVHPHLEYAAHVWHPHIQCVIQLLERMQKLSYRMCTKAWNAGYEELLTTLQLPTLSNHRLFLEFALYSRSFMDCVTFIHMYFLPGRLGHMFVDL